MLVRVVIAVVLFAVLAAARVVARASPQPRRADPDPAASRRPNSTGPTSSGPTRRGSSCCSRRARATRAPGLYDKARALESDEVAVTEVEYFEHRDLHDRYHIDAAPMTLVADAAGVVRVSFIGAFAAAELWTAVAELRAN